MRFMVLIKANKDSEAGVMPSDQLLADMGKFNDELLKAGVMLAGDGLQPSSKGARVRFSGSKRTVVDGPFAETKELIAGYWIWQVKSKEEAIEWIKRCPNPMPGDEPEIELRQLFEAEDFGDKSCAGTAVPAVPPARGATPYLTIKGASDAIGYYERVFGAKLVVRLDAPDGKVMHAEMEVGPARFMLTEESPQYGALSPLTLGGSASTAVVYVPDVDATYARAVAAGAKPGMPVGDQFWGDRSGSITDPFGHQWFISTHKEEPSHEEIQRRVKELFAKGAPC